MSANARSYRIGEAAIEAGVSPANIRYYEREGLLSPTPRQENSYRVYAQGDIHQLRFIRLCRALDMSLEEVRTLLGLDLRRKTDCAAATVALDQHLEHVRARMTELKGLHAELLDLRSRCDGRGSKCRIIEALHSKADSLPPAAQQPKANRHV